MKKTKLVFVILFVVSLIATALLLHVFAPAYRDSFIVFAVGAILCVVAISQMLLFRSCKVKVHAVMVDYGFEQFKAHLISSPTFTYEYAGKTYTGSCMDSLSQRYVCKHYRIGESYEIYLSQKDPAIFKAAKRVRIFACLMLAFGAGIMGLSVYSAFFML